MEAPKIIKSGGHCYDGCGWFECSFWSRTGENDNREHRCRLFGGVDGVKKSASKALVVCDKIYGTSYEGEV